jgi:outer membrane protein assembly factor BamB
MREGMIKMNDNDNMKRIIRSASRPRKVDAHADKRIFSLIEQKTAKIAPKPRFFTFLKLNPRLAFALCALLVVPLAVTGVILLRSESVYHPPFVVISQQQGMLENERTPLESGYEVREHDRLSTRAAEQVTFQRSDAMAMHLFGGSRLEVLCYTPASPHMEVDLSAGALYINKETPFRKSARFQIDVRKHAFILTGTRLYVQVDEDLTITGICYQGVVEVVKLVGNGWQQVCMLHENEKIIIKENGDWQIFDSDELSDREKAFDREISAHIPFKWHFSEPLPRRVPQDARAAEETEAPAQEKESEIAFKKTDYTIIKVGSLASGKLGSGKVNFFAYALKQSTACIVNGREAYLFTPDKITRIPLPAGQQFIKIQPVITGNYLCVFSTQVLYLIARSTLQTVHTFPIGEIGFVADNYAARLQGGTLYIPFQNSGYYRLASDEENPTLVKVFEEPFPIAPLVKDNSIIVGSYYHKYLAEIDFAGQVQWKYMLQGASYCNVQKVGSGLYMYVEQAHGPALIKLNQDGVKIQEWSLPGRLTSDFVMYNNLMFGITKQGELFAFNTATSTHKIIARVFTGQLSTGELRTLGILIHNGRLYAGTDKGSVIIYNIQRAEIEEIVRVAAGEAFYSKPFIIGHALYCISNSGVLYKIVKSGT